MRRALFGDTPSHEMHQRVDFDRSDIGVALPVKLPVEEDRECGPRCDRQAQIAPDCFRIGFAAAQTLDEQGLIGKSLCEDLEHQVFWIVRHRFGYLSDGRHQAAHTQTLPPDSNVISLRDPSIMRSSGAMRDGVQCTRSAAVPGSVRTR